VSEDAAVEDMVEMRSGSMSRVFEEIRETRQTTAGVYISPETSLECTAVLACVRVISESVASLPLNVYRRLPGGGKEIAEELPLQEVIAHQPNSWMTSFEFRELMQSWLLLWGNAYAFIKSGRRGAVTELIPLHPSRMEVKRLENGRLRYEYTPPDKVVPDKYTQDQILHLRWLSQDGVTGYVPTTLSRDAIALARATELHSGAYFGNGARAGTVIETSEPHKPETLQRLRQSWEDMHRGSDKAFKTAVLPHGMSVKELTTNNVNAQLIETRRYQCLEVARVYRVPAHLIGELQDVRHSTVEQAAIDFVTFSLMPHLRRWQGVFRRDLIADDRTYFVEFDINSLMAGDYAARSQFLREMFHMGCLSVDEVRAAIGYNPLPDERGDKRFIQVNMQLLDAFTLENPTAGMAVEEPDVAPVGAPVEPSGSPDPASEPSPGSEGRDAAELLWTSTLRRLAAIEADGILERRKKPAKLSAWLEAHEQRMRTELCDAAQATGRDIDDFVAAWGEKSRDLLLDCHRSGKAYEEVTESWTDRTN
jgi:HK97 family phage portal protein